MPTFDFITISPIDWYSPPISANWLTNAQVSVGPNDDRWSLAAYVRNIEDQRTRIFSSLHPTTNLLVAGATGPRTYGVRASAKF